MKPNIVPIFQYDDAPGAVEFLVHAFGFTKGRIQMTSAGALSRAEMRFGASAICVGAAAAATGPSAGVRQRIHVVTVNTHESITRDPGGFFWSFGPDDMGGGDGEVTIVPELRYRDIVSAGAWLREHFGFETTFAVPGPDDRPVHVEMRLGDGTIYIGPLSTEGGFGSVTQFANVVVEDPDAHHARAAAAGANVVIAPHDTPFGARFYAARDPENVLWWLSTYRPAKPGTAPVHL